MWSRRAVVAGMACTCAAHATLAASRPTTIDLTAMPRAVHERFMRLAIAKARGNPAWPFGAVIVRAADGAVMGSGVNDWARNPTLHGEIAAMDDYVRRHGNHGWNGMILYTTGEPCPMCMSALVWAGIGGVVYATSIPALTRLGMNQINIRADDVIGAAPFYRGGLLGGVLAEETDRMFANRKQG